MTPGAPFYRVRDLGTIFIFTDVSLSFKLFGGFFGFVMIVVVPLHAPL